MARADLEGLYAMLRSAPRPATIGEMRANFEQLAPLLNANPPAVATVESNVAVAPGVVAELIVPPGKLPLPVLIYLHGGGWSIGSVRTHAKLARELAVGTGALVVNVDYRLAPEHPFPVPLDDCIAAARWTRASIGRYGGDPERIAIGGDSAGGNLSAAVINDLRGEITFRAALLIYGAFDLYTSRRDYELNAGEEDPVLTKQAMDMMLGAYLSGGASTDDPRVSPIKGDLADFPPTCMLVGKPDPLYGDSVALQHVLSARGATPELHVYDHMPHAFVQLGLPESAAAIATGCAFLRTHLG